MRTTGNTLDWGFELAQEKADRKRSVFPILSLIISGIVLSAVFCTLLLFEWQIEYSNTEGAKREIEALAGSLSTQAAPALCDGDFTEAGRIISSGLAWNPWITDVLFVRNSDNVIKYDIHSDREGRTLDDNLHVKGSQRLDFPVICWEGPAYGDDIDREERGRILVGMRNIPFRKARQLENIATVAKQIDRTLSEAIEQGEFARVHHIVKRLVIDNPEMAYAQILRKDGRVIYSSGDEETLKNMGIAGEGEFVRTKMGNQAAWVTARTPLNITPVHTQAGASVYDVAIAIVRDGKKTGVIRLGFSQSESVWTRTNFNYIFIIFTFLLVVAGIIMASVISYIVVSPIRSLAQEAVRLGRGEGDETITVRSELAEIRDLTDSFNKLIEQKNAAYSDLKEHEKKLRELSQKVISSQEEERTRLSQELHDDLGQQMTAVLFSIAALKDMEHITRQDVSELEETIKNITAELRKISRGLSPMIINTAGLESALTSLIWNIRETAQLTIDTMIDTPEMKLEPDKAIAIYRVCQEAMNNVVRHSGARNAVVRFYQDADNLVLVIADDGSGFDLKTARDKHGLGIVGMSERAILCNGDLEIETKPGAGTKIILRVKHKNRETDN